MFQLPRFAQKGLLFISVCAHFNRDEEPDIKLGEDLYVTAEVGRSGDEPIVASKFVGTLENGARHYHVGAGLKSKAPSSPVDVQSKTGKKSRQEPLIPPKVLLGRKPVVMIWGSFCVGRSKIADSSFVRILTDASIPWGNVTLSIQGVSAAVSGDNDGIVELRWSFESEDKITVDICAYRPLAINDETFREAYTILQSALERLVLRGSKKKRAKPNDTRSF